MSRRASRALTFEMGRSAEYHGCAFEDDSIAVPIRINHSFAPIKSPKRSWRLKQSKLTVHIFRMIGHRLTLAVDNLV